MTEGEAAGLVTNRRDDHGVLTLSLNDPSTYNALSSRMINRLQTEVTSANNDNETRVIVLRGMGKGFCAGHDLGEVLSFEDDNACRGMLRSCAALMQSIHCSAKPTIVQVHGAASAAGCQIVASADLAFADEAAQFATPGVNIGLFCSTPMVALGRAVSSKHALQMLLTGDPISAQQAVEIGLINEVVPAGGLEARVSEVARRIASKSSHVVGMGKVAFRRQMNLSLSDAYEMCNEVVIANLKAADAKEGIHAFLNGRPPRWRDS